MAKGKAKPRSKKPAAGVDVTALSVPELADLIGASVRTVRAHVKAGAPFAPGRPRRVSLIAYAAWLNREVRTRGEAAP